MNYKWIIRRNGDYYTGIYTGIWWCREQGRAKQYDSAEDARINLLGNSEYLDNIEIIPVDATHSSDDAISHFIQNASDLVEQCVAFATYWNAVAERITLTPMQKDQLQKAREVLNARFDKALKPTWLEDV